MSQSIRVLIVDDSPLASSLLASIMHTDPAIVVVGVAHDGSEALEQIPRLQPDLVTMDVWMPRMDGFAAVKQVMARYPRPILVVTASLARRDVDISLKMLAAGALDVMEKPAAVDEASWTRACQTLIEKVKVLARAPGAGGLRERRPAAGANSGRNGGTIPDGRPVPPPAETLPRRAAGLSSAASKPQGASPTLAPLPPHVPPGPCRDYRFVAIAASTGGPQALVKILVSLPAHFKLPILIVQHIAVGFTQGLADWLGHECGRPLHLAAAGERPAPGTVLLAPDGQHMILQPNGTIGLIDGPPGELRPSADVLLRSVAAVGGNRAIGVILTGMGRDGADGLRAIRLAGGYTIAQDEATSMIFGMPQVAIGMGIVDEVLAVDAIPGRLTQIVTG